MDFSNFKEEQKEVIALEKDILKARSLIRDAMARYKKTKLKARSKKQAENIEEMFGELKLYNFDERELLDAYGYGCISEKEYERLRERLRLYQEFISENGKFKDRITDMLEYALISIEDPYRSRIEAYNEMKAAVDKSKKEALEREVAFEREKYLRGLS